MTSPYKQKLELTWIGKDECQRLEPRVLVEDPANSFGDPKLSHHDDIFPTICKLMSKR